MKLAKGVPGGWLWTNVVPAPSEQHSDRQEKQVVDAQLEMVRAVRRANRKLTKQEVLDRVSRQKSCSVVAFSRLRDQGAFLVTTEERLRSNGRPYPLELFEMDSNGPYREGK